MADVTTVPITPTEPIPTDPSSPMTYAQGERLLQMVSDFKDMVGQKFDSALSLLTDIKSNTTPVVYDTSNIPPTSGATYGQVDAILTYLDHIVRWGMYGIAFFVIWFVVRWLYRYLGGFFTGL